MTDTDNTPTYQPRYPLAAAAGLLAIGVVILCLPMLRGQFVSGTMSDQVWAGLPFRTFWSEEFHRAGHIPLWNPYIFGGLPFVGAMHGDIFYPTSFLRLIFRADTVLNIVFA
ncbi:MAG TPA: hypothetical protein VGI92_13825, partial [Gemmatimonadales bacterium]